MRDIRFVKHVAAAVMGASLMFGGVAAGVGSITPAALAQEAGGSTYYVDIAALNVRSTPSLAGTIVSSLSYGAVVSLVGDPVTADGYVWYHVQQGGNLLGWSVNGFTLGTAPTNGGTTPTPTTPTTPTTPPTGDEFIYGSFVAVNTDLLNVRSSPSISASILTVYSNGRQAVVTGEAQVADDITWYPVNKLGWVAGQYLTRIGGGTAGFRYGDRVGLCCLGNRGFRSSPSLSAPAIAYGGVFTITGDATVADGLVWYPVDNGGWALAEDLAAATGSGSGSTDETYQYGDHVLVITDGLNVRSSPSITASILSVYPFHQGALITGDPVVADGYTWYPVDNYGWVASQYIVSA